MVLRRATRSLLWSTAAFLLPAFAGAQGFGLNEIGTCALSRAFANTGGPCKDASAIYWNPAATTQLPGWSVLAGAAVIPLKGKFERDSTSSSYDTEIPTAIVPHVFVNFMPANSKLSYGAGLYVPYGLTSQWGDDFPGRFLAKKAALQSPYVQANVAYKLGSRWSIGGGPILSHSTVELVQSIDLSEQPLPTGVGTFANAGIAKRTEFARATLKGSATGYGAHIGFLGQINERWSVGGRFLTPIWFNYKDADATFVPVATNLVIPAALTLAPGVVVPAGTPVDNITAPQFLTGGKLVNQTGSTTLTHPAQIEVGLGYTGFKDWQVNVDYLWAGWRQFKTIVIDFSNATTPDRTLIEDYTNSSSFRIGAERSLENGWKLRGGASLVTAAAPEETVTPLLPDQDRRYFTLGAAIPFMGRFTLDAGYLNIWTAGARGRLDDRTATTQTAAQLNSGVFSLGAHVFSASLKATF